MERVFITGITGATGVPLANLLHTKGHSVAGCSLRGRTPDCGLHPDIYTFAADLSDPVACCRALGDWGMGVVVHLAGITNVSDAMARPHVALATNVGALFTMADILSDRPDVRFIVASSSEVYGDTEGVLTNQTPPAPLSAYGVTKMAQEHVTPDQTNVRTFWNINPARADSAVSQFARQIAEIEVGKREALQHGSLDAERSFVSYVDVVRAYATLVESKVSGTFNVGSDRVEDIHPMRTYLELMVGMAHTDIPVKHNRRKLADPHVTSPGIPDIYPLKSLGWEPEANLHETLARTLHYWRERVR